jgi:hypothetical protein
VQVDVEYLSSICSEKGLLYVYIESLDNLDKIIHPVWSYSSGLLEFLLNAVTLLLSP